MAITCPRCGSDFDVTLFQFGHRVRCRCGTDVVYPGTDERAGHVAAQGQHKVISHKDRGGETDPMPEPRRRGSY
jgi:hypothetical protein